MTKAQENLVKKTNLIKKIYDRVSKHKQIIIVNLLNVGSSQCQLIRRKLAEKKAELVIGKNVRSFH